MLLIRGEAAYDSNDSNKRLNRYFLCAALQVTLLPPPSVTVTLQSGNAVSEKLYYAGTEILLPTSEEPSFAGWVGSDGTLLPSGGRLVLQEDVAYTALFADFRLLEGAAVSTASLPPSLRFSAVLREDHYQALAPHVTLGAALMQNENPLAEQEAQLASQTVTSVHNVAWRRLTADTLPLDATAYADLFSASFFLQITYSDDSTKRIYASGEPSYRSVLGVADAVLADRSILYSTETVSLLQAVLRGE